MNNRSTCAAAVLYYVSFLSFLPLSLFSFTLKTIGKKRTTTAIISVTKVFPKSLCGLFCVGGRDKRRISSIVGDDSLFSLGLGRNSVAQTEEHTHRVIVQFLSRDECSIGGRERDNYRGRKRERTTGLPLVVSFGWPRRLEGKTGKDRS